MEYIKDSLINAFMFWTMFCFPPISIFLFVMFAGWDASVLIVARAWDDMIRTIGVLIGLVLLIVLIGAIL